MYKKKVLALVLAALLIVSLMPTLASAALDPVPEELSAAFYIGLWPVTDPHEPGLDTSNIPDGAEVYGFFGADYSVLPVPEAVAGYTKVDAIADLIAGTYAVVTPTTFSYIVILPVTAAPDTQPAEAPEEPAEPEEPVAPVEVVPPIIELPSEATATPTNDKVTLNGEEVPVVAAYKINGENYFKLRDIAALLNTFDVSYADKKIGLLIGVAYTPDLSNPVSAEAPTEEAVAKLSKDKVYVADEEIALTAYKIAGSNYYRLADLAASSIGITVMYDDETKTVSIVSTADADTQPAEAPEETAETPTEEAEEAEAPAAEQVTVSSILADLTASEAGVGANTKAYSFDSLADAQATIDALAALGYTEDASALGETTTQAENTYSTFDLSAFGMTGVTLYVYVA